MKWSEGHPGRVFVLRLEHRDRLPDCIEGFAAQNGISTGLAVLVGGVSGGQVVVGPRRNDQRPPEPVLLPVDGAHEAAGVGVIAPDEEGRPRLHMHAALGRSGQTITGCLRPGVDTWVVGEVIIYEITGARASRFRDGETGFSLLEPGTG